MKKREAWERNCVCVLEKDLGRLIERKNGQTKGKLESACAGESECADECVSVFERG